MERKLVSSWIWQYIPLLQKTTLILNYSIAYDHNNSELLYYEEYPESIVDVSQLQQMLEKAKGYGYRQVGFIVDRGYFSKENIHFMEKSGYEIIIMMKGMKSLVRDLVLSVKGSFEEKRELACVITR